MLYIVDDDEETGFLLEAALMSIVDNISIYTKPADFLHLTLTSRDILLLDLMMPEIDGVEVIRELAKKSCPASIIIMSGYDQSVLHSVEKLAKEYGLSMKGHLSKPIVISKLRTVILTILEDSENLFSVDDNSTQLFAFTPQKKDLWHAILEQQLVLYYQPQIEIRSGRLLGFEGLVRWQHPQFGVVFPDQFIGLAESTGLINDLTNEVIRIAVNQCRQWSNLGRQYKLSINLSAENINNLELPEKLSNIIESNQLDPTSMVLEVTESALMKEMTLSTDILTRLRLKGFPLSIDDFGTGYSSLSQLHRIPFTELKIDQSFVMTMLEEDESRAIVETCIMLGHRLHMAVVAEGVETLQIYQLLETLGCDIAQGYLISKPIPPDQLENWCRQYQPNQYMM